jgi:hypothetical protein
MPQSTARNLNASLVYFAIVMGAGFVLGMIRVPLLVPRLGERYAELLEMPFMLVIIILAARYVIRRFVLPAQLSVRLPVGFIALVCVVLTELLLVVIMQGESVAQYFGSRDPVSGLVYLCMLLLFALMPAILARRSQEPVMLSGKKNHSFIIVYGTRDTPLLHIQHFLLLVSVPASETESKQTDTCKYEA